MYEIILMEGNKTWKIYECPTVPIVGDTLLLADGAQFKINKRIFSTTQLMKVIILGKII